MVDHKKMKQYQNMAKEYTCGSCSSKMEAPMHCGHPMHPETKEDGEHWICWMGASCGDKVINACCDAIKLNPNN